MEMQARKENSREEGEGEGERYENDNALTGI